MRILLALSALGGLIAGSRHVLNFLKQREKNLRPKIQKNQSAAQVKPRKRRAASPRSVTQHRAR